MNRFLFLAILFVVPQFIPIQTAFSQSDSRVPASQTMQAPGSETMDEDLLQQKTKDISQTLRCAVCQSESVWESNATLAIQMRDIIRERLIEGQTGDEIRAYFVSRYGDYIVFKPRFRGLNLLLWGGPFILLVIGGVILCRNLRRWSTRPVGTEPEPMAPISEKQRERIEREIRSFK